MLTLVLKHAILPVRTNHIALPMTFAQTRCLSPPPKHLVSRPAEVTCNQSQQTLKRILTYSHKTLENLEEELTRNIDLDCPHFPLNKNKVLP